MMAHLPQQRFRFRETHFNVPITTIRDEQFVFLTDIHDTINYNIQSFTVNGNSLAPLRNKDNGHREEPHRIRAFINEIIYCNEPKKNEIDQNLHNEVIQLHKKVDKVLDNTEILKDKANAILRQTYQLAEFNVPRMFIVLPEETNKLNPLNLIRHSYRLFFLCECEEQRHLAFHEGYELQQPNEFMKKYGPYLKKMLTMVKYTMMAGSFAMPALGAVGCNIPVPDCLTDKDFWENLDDKLNQINDVLDQVTNHEKLDMSSDSHMEGADLRQIEYFVKQKDDRRTLGNLFRMTSSEGNVRWVCIHHYDKFYSVKKQNEFRQNFRKFGGIIRDDVFTIDNDGAKQFDKILSAINDGLHLFKLVLRDCDLKVYAFDKLLTMVGERPYIKCLELSSIKVFSTVGFMYTHKELIKKLEEILKKREEIVKKREDLTIKYIVEYPKDKPGPDPVLFDYAIKKSTDNLLLQVYTRDDGKQIVFQDLDKTALLEMVKSLGNSTTIQYCSMNQFDQKLSDSLLFNISITKLTIFLVKFDEQKTSALRNLLSKRKYLQELRLSKCENLSPLTTMLRQVLANNSELNVLAISGISDEIQLIDLATMLEENKHLTELKLAMEIHINVQTFIRISQALKKNTTLKILKLTEILGGNVQQDSCINVFELFFRKTSIQQLALHFRDHKPKVSLFRETIQSSEIVQVLDLSNCNLLPDKKLLGVNAINISSSLVSLSIHYCQFAFVDAVDLFRGLAQNKTLTTLYLSSLFIPSNKSTTNLTTELANMLASNTGLRKLAYSHGTLGDKAAIVIAEALKRNRTLEEVHFDHNRIGNEGAVALVDALNINNVLVVLNIENNDIKYEGVIDVFQSLLCNKTLRHLYISQSNLKENIGLVNRAKEELLNVNKFINIY